MKIKTVKAKWFNKKENVWKHKVYTYNDYSRKSTRGYVIVNAKGVINKKNYQKLLSQLQSKATSNIEKLMIEANLESYTKERSAINKRRASSLNKKLTSTSYLAHLELLADNSPEAKLNAMFTNLGVTSKEIADMYDFDIDDVEDVNNWQGDNFISPDGRTFAISWTYTGSVLNEIF